jgi:hypothetical protein
MFLTLVFRLHGRPELRVEVGNVHVAAKHQGVLSKGWLTPFRLYLNRVSEMKRASILPQLWRSGT